MTFAYYRKVDLATPHGMLEDVEADFQIDLERFPDEPTSWGAPRGYAYTAVAHLKSIHLEKTKLSTEQVTAWIGSKAVEKLEEFVAESYLDAGSYRGEYA